MFHPWLPFEWIVATRFLREGRLQTLFIVAGVAIGVAMIVFMSALMAGRQSNFIRRALSSQALGVRKSYHPGTAIEVEMLHGIDLTVRRGAFCAVVGPSGSGKSTLLDLIGLLDRPTSGLLSICGKQTTTLADRALTRLRGHAIGFVFQHHHLITAFSALENVMMPMLGAAGFADEAMRQRAASLLASVGLTPWHNNLAGNLSGGQQQRVAVARALAMDPAVLLADEPTGNLDTGSADEVFALLRRFNAEHGTTVLSVTHSAALAARCDTTIEVIDGRVMGAPGAS